MFGFGWYRGYGSRRTGRRMMPARGRNLLREVVLFKATLACWRALPRRGSAEHGEDLRRCNLTPNAREWCGGTGRREIRGECC